MQSDGNDANEPALPPLRGVTAENHGPIGLIAASTLIIISTLAVGVKLWTRFAATRNVVLNDVVIFACDLVIVALPALMMPNVQVSSVKRWTVILLFAMRLVTPAFTAVSIVAPRKYYRGSADERPYPAITPTVWSSCAMNLSIVTACIPSIKRFLADWAAGLSVITISEPFELKHSSGNLAAAAYMSGSGIGSRMATKLGLASMNKSEVVSGPRAARRETQEEEMSRRRMEKREDTPDRAKGLTDGVIMHSIDYRVEFEDPRLSQ